MGPCVLPLKEAVYFFKGASGAEARPLEPQFERSELQFLYDHRRLHFQGRGGESPHRFTAKSGDFHRSLKD